MEIKQDKNTGAGYIIFNDDELKIINEKKCLTMTPENLRHFGNHLVKIVAEWNLYFKKDVRNLQTEDDIDVKTS